jgi:hypothetical protein
MSISKQTYNILKWCILVLAYGFLLYKLTTFNEYKSFFAQWQSVNFQQFSWLILAIFLLPLNWFLESIKWKVILSNLEKISTFTAFKSVLSGITVGFFTPNRIGEYPGRVVYISNQNKVPSIALGFVGSLAQTLVILICGLPSAFIFFTHEKEFELLVGKTLWVFFFFGILLLSVYFLLPIVSKYFLKIAIKQKKIEETLLTIRSFSQKKLFKIFLFSFLRYTVFCLQFFLVLSFFGIDLTITEAIISIATNYLFVTFTPSIALSEAAIRGSYSILFIGAFSENLIGIATAGITIWIINYCLPMIVGSVFFAKSKL